MQCAAWYVLECHKSDLLVIEELLLSIHKYTYLSELNNVFSALKLIQSLRLYYKTVSFVLGALIDNFYRNILLGLHVDGLDNDSVAACAEESLEMVEFGEMLLVERIFFFERQSIDIGQAKTLFKLLFELLLVLSLFLGRYVIGVAGRKFPRAERFIRGGRFDSFLV